MNYFYYDQNNQKRGPASEQQLKELAAKGLIGPHTPMKTDTGHKGVAGQIPGIEFPPQGTAPPPPSPPKQVFCTNCAQPVAENAAGCMSCGLKPTGHKKFCRQCGAARTPEQIVCTQCGANLAATFMPDAKKVMETVVSSSSGAAIKKFAFGTVAIALVVGVIWYVLPFLSFSLGGSTMYLNQLKKAKSGDEVEYETSISIGGERDRDRVRHRFSIEVLSNDGRRIRLQRTFQDWNQYRNEWSSEDKMPLLEIELSSLKSDVDLVRAIMREMMRDAPREIRDAVDKIDWEVRGGKRTSETMTMAGQSFKCTVTPLTVSATSGSVTTTVRDIKQWTSPEVPVTGLVKAEFQGRDQVAMMMGPAGTFSISIELTRSRKR